MAKKGIFFSGRNSLSMAGISSISQICTLSEDSFVYKEEEAVNAIHNSYSDGDLPVVSCHFAEYFVI
jgi:hypothetical protein